MLTPATGIFASWRKRQVIQPLDITAPISTHLHTGINMHHAEFCTLYVPVYCRSEGQRSIEPIAVVPPQLSIEKGDYRDS